VDDELASRIAGVGALVEPARRALYLYVAQQSEPVSREQAATACDLPLHSAKFHLDRLVTEGLLEVSFRRLTGRTGPGAGRTAKLYQRAEREVAVSLPERRYDLAGDILAEAIDRTGNGGTQVLAAVVEVAEERGRAMAAGEEVTAGSDQERTAQVLARHGYEPRRFDDDVCLSNCPFDRLAKDHTELVCSMNLALVGGLLEGLGCDSLEAVLDPQPGLCCVKAHARRS
jgi:predicted ArsR family transcriptional regulator